MSHRISKSQAKEKLEWEKHCQELNKAGLKVDNMPQWRKKQLAKMSNTKKFIEMLKKRGGYYLKEKKGEKDVQETEDTSA